MRRISLWMRAHPLVGDTLIAVALFALDVLTYSLFVAFPVPELPAPPWYRAIPLSVCLLAAVPLRRRYPVFTAYWVLVWSVPHVAFGMGTLAFGVAVLSCVAVYTLVVYAGRRQAAFYTALSLVVSLIHQLVQFPEDWLVNTVTVTLSLALCWVLGEFVGARRAYQAEVEARLALLENERHQATRIAVAEERERIARELHDVVAHAVSVIVVHADGASYAVRDNPELAERAVGTISETGRSALAELRRLLAILRDDQLGDHGGDQLGDHGGDQLGDHGGDRGEQLGGQGGRRGDDARTPQPTAADLAELVERMESAELSVRLDVDGGLDDLPAGVSLGVYRIVQEALTNSLKHAGVGTRAQVRVRRSGASDADGGAVHVEVDDDGAGRAHPLLVPEDGRGSVGRTGGGDTETAGVPVEQADGNGLIGMRERAHVHGGTLEAGPRPGGGWRVRAVLPVRLGA